MSRQVTEQQIEEARQAIRPMIPLVMVTLLEVANLLRRGETYSQALEDSLVVIGTKIIESDKF